MLLYVHHEQVIGLWNIHIHISHGSMHFYIKVKLGRYADRIIPSPSSVILQMNRSGSGELLRVTWLVGLQQAAQFSASCFSIRSCIFRNYQVSMRFSCSRSSSMLSLFEDTSTFLWPQSRFSHLIHSHCRKSCAIPNLCTATLRPSLRLQLRG